MTMRRGEISAAIAREREILARDLAGDGIAALA